MKKRCLAALLALAILFTTNVTGNVYAQEVAEGMPEETGFKGEYEELDDRDSRIQYNGSWTDWLQEGDLYQGTQKYTEHKGASATLSFIGTGVQVRGIKSSSGSIFNVYIDGQIYQKNINTYVEGYNSREHEPLFAVDGLGHGQHTITVELSQDNSPTQTGNRLMLDSFIVFQEDQNFVNSISVSSEDGSDFLDYVTGSLQMTASVTPTAAQKDVLWTVYPEDAANISADGVLTPKSVSGTVTVKAQALDGSHREATKEIKIGTNNEGDIATLTAAFEEYAPLVESEYTKDSWTSFNTALESARKVVEQNSDNKTTILKALEDLKKAAFNLSIRKLKIACVGDSITYGSKANPIEVYSYPAQLQELLGEFYDVRNFGVSSKTLSYTSTDAYVNTEAYKQSKNFQPDIVIIMLGTNDSKEKNWVSNEYFSECMLKLVNEYRTLASMPKVLIASSPSVDENLDNLSTPDATGNRIRNYRILENIAPMQKAMAAQLGSQLIDLNAASLAEEDWNWDYLSTDYIHPCNEGYTFITDVMYNGLMASMGDTSELDAAIKAGEGYLESSKYTKESKEAYQAVFEPLKLLRTKALREGYGQIEIDNLYASVKEASSILKSAQSLTITTTTQEVKVGKNLLFRAATTGMTEKVTWSLSNNRVGTINKNTGTFTAKAKGGVYVIATCGDLTTKVPLYVR